MYHLTAAHRTLPLGATVAVTHLRTGRQVVVRINDRGPYVDSRRCIIDLRRLDDAACGLIGHAHCIIPAINQAVQIAAVASNITTRP
jgi:rare lipoprotein A